MGARYIAGPGASALAVKIAYPWEDNMLCRHRPRRHGRRRVAAFAVIAGLAALTQFAPARAQDAGAWLKGQTVHLIVGYSPGGGYDTYARMLAPHFEKRTGATVVVENKPGGGGMTALNQMVRGKPDGLTMQVLNGESAIMWQLTRQTGVAYDMSKVAMLGRIQEEPHFFLVHPSWPDSLKEIVASGKKLKFTATRRIDNLGDYAAVLCQALNMNCQIITGYKGSKEAGLAVMNGEADALTISESSGFNYSQGGRTKIVTTIGHKRSELMPNMPTIYEMFQLKPDDKWWIDFRLSVKAIGRCIVAAPGIPADRLAHLQKVWKDILTDPAVIAEGKKSRHEFDYESPDKMQAIVRDLLEKLPADKVEKVRDVLVKKFSS
jgi:tripartite-type tricarboxylate transporter receptor subunit TctC